jgi:voltage-gated potassium channel
MFLQLLVAFPLAVATVLVHGAGTARLLVLASRHGVLEARRRNTKMRMSILTRLVAALLMLHFVEMIIWAAVFTAIGVFPAFEASLYYSLMSFTTVGYGDVVPPESWRLLGPVEATVGVLMLGWSTGIIVAAVQRILGVPKSVES